MDSICLSIDFDFWSFEDPNWDFVRNETELYSTAMWYHRCAGFATLGKDLTGEAVIEDSVVSPTDFLSLLEGKGFEFSERCRLFISDSHGYAYRSLMSAPRSSTIINVDAHHDMGYGDYEAKLSSGYTEAGSWLEALRRDRKDLKIHQIYPSWKTEALEEAADVEARGLENWSFSVLSSGDKLEGLSGMVSIVHICKSSAWVPPWHDKAFNRLVDAFEQVVGTAAVCGRNPAEERVFSANRLAELTTLYQSTYGKVVSPEKVL